MADISLEQDQQLKRAFAEAIEEADRNGKAVIPISDFCRGWPTARIVLSFLAELDATPKAIKEAIRLVIRAGDAAAGILCP